MAQSPFHHSNLFITSLQAICITTCVLWVVRYVGEQSPFSLLDALTIPIWVSVVIGALTLAARWTRTQGMKRWPQLLMLAFTAGLSSALVNLSFECFNAVLLGGLAGSALFRVEMARVALVGFLDGDALFGFWALLVELPRRIAEQERQDLERRALEQEAELASIRATLEPHFVLNALNTISGLVTEDPREARELLAGLGDLLRDTLDHSRTSHWSVRREIQWLKRFADILSSRHYGRLDFIWEIDPDAWEVQIPTLLLQPLVENAVRHGALRKPEGGVVHVTISVSPEDVRCVIVDNGPGLPSPDIQHGGQGLDLVRRRLALESPEASFNLELSEAGACASLRLPRRDV